MKVNVLAPVMGRIVRFNMVNGGTVPAIVISFSRGEGATLSVFFSDRPKTLTRVPYSHPKLNIPNTWHWPNEAPEEKSFFEYEAP